MVPLGLAEQEGLVDDDGPAPHGGPDQAEHHELDDEVRLPEQPEEGHVVRDLRALDGIAGFMDRSSSFAGPRT
jgi:hypothetical protein